MAIDLGHRILDAAPKGGEAVVDAICRQTSGAIIRRGRVTRKAVEYTDQAFDIGTIDIGEGSESCTLHVMNEYMAVTGGSGQRLASYPDVITTLDTNGSPVSVGHISEGMELLVLRIAREHVPLSSSVTDASVYPVCEEALGMNFASYALGGSSPVLSP